MPQLLVFPCDRLVPFLNILSRVPFILGETNSIQIGRQQHLARLMRGQCIFQDTMELKRRIVFVDGSCLKVSVVMELGLNMFGIN